MAEAPMESGEVHGETAATEFTGKFEGICLVTGCGPEVNEASNGLIWIRLRDLGKVFPGKDWWFTAHDQVKKELLATALVALSNHHTVEVWANVETDDPTQVRKGTVHGIYPVR